MPRHVACALQELFRKELERLQDQQILAPLGVDEKWNGATALSECLSQMAEYACALTPQYSTKHSSYQYIEVLKSMTYCPN